MARLSRRTKKVLAIVLAVLGALAIITPREGIACSVVGLLPMTEIAPRLYSTTNLTVDQRSALATLLSESRARIAETYGTPKADPIIISSATGRGLNWFRANDYGKTTFVFGRACVVLGPKGHNTDVAAHELVHPEIFDRVGMIKRTLEIPSWFDEGAAMQVDTRPAYAPRVLASEPRPDIKRFDTASKFFVGAEREVIIKYAAAKQEVAEWLARNGGSKALYPMLAAIRDGIPFSAAYAAAKP